jgi:hypothetical protein
MMQLSSVPRKLVDISVLPSKDGKTRRLFILADGKRSLAEIFSMCKFENREGFDLVQSLVEDGQVQLLNNSSPMVIQPGVVDEQLVPVDTFINGLTAELSIFIGPVASIVISDFDLPEKEIGINLRRQIINTVIGEVDDADKGSFMRSVQAAKWI